MTSRDYTSLQIGMHVWVQFGKCIYRSCGDELGFVSVPTSVGGHIDPSEGVVLILHSHTHEKTMMND